MRFDQYRYLYPPRPEIAAAPNTLHLFETMGWLAQAKMNGTNCTIYIGPEGQCFAMGRHGPDNPLQWQPGAPWRAFQATLPGDGWYAFVGELLHSKGVGVRDTVYLHDLLVDDGEYLIGATYSQRWHRLAALCRVFAAESVEATHTVVTPGVWLATPHRHSFPAWFDAIQALPAKAAVEGLVFKDPEAKLALCSRASANSRGQHKCRVPSTNVAF